MSLSPLGTTPGGDEAPASDQPVEKKEKRFLCPRCQRRFARLEHLQRHERTHTQEKPFPCRQCDQRFSRSDLLVRHERLSHNSSLQKSNKRSSDSGGGSSNQHKRRKTVDSTTDLPTPPPLDRNITATFDAYTGNAPLSLQPTSIQPHQSINSGQGMPFATLLMAAEQAQPQPAYASQHVQLDPGQAISLQTPSNPLQSQQYVGGAYDIEDSLADLANFLDTGPLSTYQFSAFISSEQPIPFFSPESFSHATEIEPSMELQDHRLGELQGGEAVEDQGSFSRYGSRLPSLQPDERAGDKKSESKLGSKHFGDVTQEDRQTLLSKLTEFEAVIPRTFQLPSRLALSRYITAYINGFHEHMPLLHIATMTADTCSIELVLALAAVGAQYCFEGEKGVELFHVSRTIADSRIKQRDARLAAFHKRTVSEHSTGHANGLVDERSSGRSTSISGHLGLPSQSTDSRPPLPKEDLIQTAQALFILMAMATWAKHWEILREALAIQSVLATLVRDDGFQYTTLPDTVDWVTWARHESSKRTKFLVYCFFNLHCIVYNIPSLILSSELDMALPCNANEFKAPNEAKWRETRSKSSTTEMSFQTALSRLFSRGSGNDKVAYNSSLADYVLVHSIIQHIFFVRQVSRYRFYNQGEIPPEDVNATENALRNWQLAWKRNPESSLNPMNPNGPITFNSTALLRLAYIRLNVDIGPGRALDTRDPVQIAQAFSQSPPLKRTPKLLRAVLHSAHALSIPVKIGIHLVAQTQTFNWSIQHSLCTLECAFTLCKWLEALTLPNAVTTITPDEWKIASLVKTMLDETEFAMPSEIPFDSQPGMKYLSASVLRVWSKVFRGAQTWAIVDIIGTSLSIYADMLEAS